MRIDNSAAKAWSAGFIDGEGCITLSCPRRAQLVVEVFQKVKAPLEVLLSLFGGSIQRNRNGWLWKVSTQKAEDCLKAVLPYLVVKREQAELGLESRDRVQRGTRHKLSVEEALWREQAYARMQELKCV